MKKQFLSSFRMVTTVGFVALLGVFSVNCAHASKKKPDVVSYVDLNRYLGVWYELASFPQRFSKGCVASQAEYTARDDGKIGVVNTCRKESFDGKVSKVSGVARVVDKKTNAKLKVKFFIFSGDYWVVDLDENYQWAVVSGPKMDSLWILSRTRQMDENLYQNIVQSLADREFDVTKLRITPQPN